mgnify:CR=1 FL=1
MAFVMGVLFGGSVIASWAAFALMDAAKDGRNQGRAELERQLGLPPGYREP